MIDQLAGLFAGPGAAAYLGEPVTIGAHMRQAGALARWFGPEVTEPVRRWDDAAKDPAARPPEFERFGALLAALVRD